MAAKFTVFMDKGKKFRFNLKASNGEILASSEAYEGKKACLKGIASIQKSAGIAKIVDETVSGEEAPKKRGRKPKTELTIRVTSPALEPKKRGRKPKVL